MNHINLWDTLIGDDEIKAISNAIKNKNISMGNITEDFEHKMASLLNVPYVVATSSGSASLYMSLMICGIGKGDEVIVPNKTFIATANAVKLTGADVVLVDTNMHNTNIDIAQIEEKITYKTKVILPVHLNGRSVDMDFINELSLKHKIIVIEDACQALLSKNKQGQHLGTLSTLGCFSLGLAKLINVGFGGFITCQDKDTYKKLLRFRNHGRLNSNTYNDMNTLGFNFKISDMIMSIGIVQLSKYKEKIKHLIEVYTIYKNTIDTLDYIDLIPVNIEYELPIYVEVTSKKRNKLIKFLDRKNITTGYLPDSLHLSNHLQQQQNFKNSLTFDETSFMLPCGPNQSIENIIYIVNILKSFNEKIH